MLLYALQQTFRFALRHFLRPTLRQTLGDTLRQIVRHALRHTLRYVLGPTLCTRYINELRHTIQTLGRFTIFQLSRLLESRFDSNKSRQEST